MFSDNISFNVFFKNSLLYSIEVSLTGFLFNDKNSFFNILLPILPLYIIFIFLFTNFIKLFKTRCFIFVLKVASLYCLCFPTFLSPFFNLLFRFLRGYAFFGFGFFELTFSDGILSAGNISLLLFSLL